MLKQIVNLVSWLSLIFIIAPSILFFFDKIDLDQVKQIMLIATITWFVAAAVSAWTTRIKQSQ